MDSISKRCASERSGQVASDTILLSKELNRQGSSEAKSGLPFVAEEVLCRLDRVTDLNAKWYESREQRPDGKTARSSRFTEG
jgi:hypothetical protein